LYKFGKEIDQLLELAVRLLDFMYHNGKAPLEYNYQMVLCCIVSIPKYLNFDWGRKFTPNFALFTPTPYY